MAQKVLVFLTNVFILVTLARSQEMLIYHPIVTDREGKIIPWFDEDPGRSYHHVIGLVWKFWDNMRTDLNGLPYYMNHQVWKQEFNDPRGIGGDQIAMALSSWQLYYPYTGNERLKANMMFMADYYLSHSLSPADCKWPNIPFPYNTLAYSGEYDGDMRNGKGVTQPDKAGSFGLELLHVYKMSSGFFIGENRRYLEAAIDIANTLADHIREGDINHSPLPYKVNVFSGQTQLLCSYDFTGTWIDTAGYTTNWAPTMQLFLDLISMKEGDTLAYHRGFDLLIRWMKIYPMKENKWGPFFEDVDGWSDTQINAMTFARFIMRHPEFFEDWKTDVRKIIEWCHSTFGNDTWIKYGVRVTNEQTYYQMPANSHSARQAADELLYESLTGDLSLRENAIRQLNWATYMVDFDGKNRFPGDENWLTDGYGDYVRHYLRAMEAMPELAPPDEDHILSSGGVIQQADYKGDLEKFYGLNFEIADSSRVVLFYRTFEMEGLETIKLRLKPSFILLDDKPLAETRIGEGFEWAGMKNGGLLKIHREKGRRVLLIQ